MTNAESASKKADYAIGREKEKHIAKIAMLRMNRQLLPVR